MTHAGLLCYANISSTTISEPLTLQRLIWKHLCKSHAVKYNKLKYQAKRKSLKAAVRAYKHLQSASSNLWPCLFACFQLHSQLSPSCCFFSFWQRSWKPNRKWHHIHPSAFCSAHGARGWWVERGSRLLFRSHSVLVAQTSQTLWSCLRLARQIKRSNLSHLST